MAVVEEGGGPQWTGGYNIKMNMVESVKRSDRELGLVGTLERVRAVMRWAVAGRKGYLVKMRQDPQQPA